MSTRAFMVLAALLLNSAVSAGAQEIPPNDTDLHASYCMEINRALAEITRPLVPSTADGAGSNAGTDVLSETTKAILSGINARFNKLRLYLLPRLMYIDPAGIVAAQTAAKADWARVQSVTDRCINECPLPKSSDLSPYTKCNSECSTRLMPDLASVQTKLKSCSNLDWLPF
jgi:hypothetical protein